MNNLYDKIRGRSKEDVKSYILEALVIERMNDESAVNLGFTSDSNISFYHGFIPVKSRVYFDINSTKSYSLDSMDYFLDFADYISDKEINNINDFINDLYVFMEKYFGKQIGLEDRRDEYFDTFAFQTSSNDQDYYETLEHLDISDFRDKGIAMSSERAVMADNILSLFGIDSYCCFGVMSHGLNSRLYSFNIVGNEDKYYLIDFASPNRVNNNDNSITYKPFVEEINDLEGLLADKCIISFDDYEILDGKKVRNGNYRRYSVGTFSKKNDSSLEL